MEHAKVHIDQTTVDTPARENETNATSMRSGDPDCAENCRGAKRPPNGRNHDVRTLLRVKWIVGINMVVTVHRGCEKDDVPQRHAVWWRKASWVRTEDGSDLNTARTDAVRCKKQPEQSKQLKNKDQCVERLISQVC